MLREGAKERASLARVGYPDIGRRDSRVPQRLSGAGQIGAAGQYREHVARGIEDVEGRLPLLEEFHADCHEGLLSSRADIELARFTRVLPAPRLKFR